MNHAARTSSVRWWPRSLPPPGGSPQQSCRPPREQAGAAGRIIECHNTPHSGCGDTQRPAGTFPAQALTSRRGGGRTRCTMNQAGAARLLAVVVLVAQAAQHLAGHPTWREFGEFATMSGWPQPTWRRTRGWCAPASVPARRPAQHRADGQGPDGRGPPAGPSAQGRRDRDGDAGINQRLGAFAGPVGYSLRWASTSAGLLR